MLNLMAMALLAAQPMAESVEELACVMDQVSPAEAGVIADDMLAGEGATTGAGFGGFVGHVTTCADRYGWDEARTVRISSATLGLIGTREFRRRLTAAGLDVAAIDAWFDEQDDEFRTQAFIDLDQETQEQDLATLFDGPVSEADGEAHAELIGGYLAARVVTLRVAQGLPLE